MTTRATVARWLGVWMCTAAGASAVRGAVDAVPQPAWAPDSIGGYASDHILVRLRPGAAERVLGTAGGARGAVSLFAQVSQRWGVREVAPLLRQMPRDAVTASRLGLDRTYRVRVPRGTDTLRMVEEFARLPEVEHAEVDGIGGAAVFPDDPFFDLQYGLHNTGQTVGGVAGTPDADIDAPEAWDLHTGSADLIIGIIDSGVDPHEDYAGKMVPGWNVVDDNDDTSDGCPHGTHVAGIAAAIGNNGTGVAGVNWGARIMPVRVLNGCFGSESQCAEGIIWATDHGADVLSISLQYYVGTDTLRSAVAYAWENGVPIVAATGNQRGRVVAFPARFDETIAVGATDNRDIRPGWSNYGPEIDVCAPGDEVYSTWQGDGYTYLSGTSMATPHVSGVVGLMWSLNPSLRPEHMKMILRNTADDLGDPGWDEFYGAGRINARAALEQAAAGIAYGDFDGDGDVDISDFNTFAGCYGGSGVPVGTECRIADADEDGDVDIVDFNTFAGNFTGSQ